MGRSASRIFGTPVYQEFLAGKRELTCTAWAIPTRNVKGWKAPVTLMTDGHYPGYEEMLREGGLGQIRRGGWRGARSALRELHGALRLRSQRRAEHRVCATTWKNMVYNFGPKPKPALEGRFVKAFNGYSVGKGHLAEAKAAINGAKLKSNGAKSVFFHQEKQAAGITVNGHGCGTGDTRERDALLAKIAGQRRT